VYAYVSLESSALNGHFRERLALATIGVMEDLPDDKTLMMEVPFDIRTNTDFIIELPTGGEEDDGEGVPREP
jgi:hypothetical protein